jgi:hypothetical protein
VGKKCVNVKHLELFGKYNRLIMKRLLVFWDKIKDGFFLIQILVAVLFFIVFFGFKWFTPNFWEIHKTTFDYLFNLFLTVLASGIFAAVLKYFQTMGIYRKELEEVLHSPELSEKITNIFTDVVYSESFLSTQNNLNEIWKKVTVCLLSSEFPNISDKVSDKLINTFFQANNLTHYYKNYHIKYKIGFDESGIITIEEHAVFTIVRGKKNKFSFVFNYIVAPSRLDETVKVNMLKIDGKEVNPDDLCNREITSEHLSYNYSVPLENKDEYVLERRMTMLQTINEDNEFYFLNERIMEDLSVDVIITDNLGLHFVSMGIEDFNFQKNAKDFNFYHRGLLLPEKGFRFIFFEK